MKACKNKECIQYGKRWYTYEYCISCGEKLGEVLPCCDKEEMNDKGFCAFCGEKKELEFAPELGNGGEEIPNVNPEQDDFAERKCSHDRK